MFVKRENGVVTAVFQWPTHKAQEVLPADHPDVVGYKTRRAEKRMSLTEARPDRVSELEQRIANLEARIK